MYTHQKGFTLIELLVVVLIIGILAAVALPQYQKTVWKARLVKVVQFQSNAMKALEVWLLEHGTIDQPYSFMGTNANASLDIDLSSGLSCDDEYECSDDYFIYTLYAENNTDPYWGGVVWAKDYDYGIWYEKYASGAIIKSCGPITQSEKAKIICPILHGIDSSYAVE